MAQPEGGAAQIQMENACSAFEMLDLSDRTNLLQWMLFQQQKTQSNSTENIQTSPSSVQINTNNDVTKEASTMMTMDVVISTSTPSDEHQMTSTSQTVETDCDVMEADALEIHLSTEDDICASPRPTSKSAETDTDSSSYSVKVFRPKRTHYKRILEIYSSDEEPTMKRMTKRQSSKSTPVESNVSEVETKKDIINSAVSVLVKSSNRPLSQIELKQQLNDKPLVMLKKCDAQPKQIPAETMGTSPEPKEKNEEVTTPNRTQQPCPFQKKKFLTPSSNQPSNSHPKSSKDVASTSKSLHQSSSKRSQRTTSSSAKDIKISQKSILKDLYSTIQPDTSTSSAPAEPSKTNYNTARKSKQHLDNASAEPEKTPKVTTSTSPSPSPPKNTLKVDKGTVMEGFLLQDYQSKKIHDLQKKVVSLEKELKSANNKSYSLEKDLRTAKSKAYDVEKELKTAHQKSTTLERDLTTANNMAKAHLNTFKMISSIATSAAAAQHPEEETGSNRTKMMNFISSCPSKRFREIQRYLKDQGFFQQ